jgi:CBS domain containing-hemolysin-like protein
MSLDPSDPDSSGKIQGLTSGLASLNLVALSAVLVSAVAVTVTWRGVYWAEIAPASVAALVVLGLVRGGAAVFASRYADTVTLRLRLPLRVLGAAAHLLLRSSYVRIVPSLDRLSVDRNGSSPSEIGISLDSNGEPLDEHEVRMIRAVVRLDETVAREIMVPRVDMVAVDVEAPISSLAEYMVKSGHSRIPVYRDDLDHIEGIAYARDVLDRTLEGSDTSSTTVREMLRPALFTPESKTLEELLSEFQQRRMHMAIVVDEYGGVSGIVTIEDLLEEIVGEIQDEFDDAEPSVVALGDDEYLMEAGVGVDQLNELLNVSVDADGFDTLGGLVYQQQGRIPSPGDAVMYDGLRIEVVSTAGRRLKRLRVTRLPDRDASPAD